MPIYAIYRDFLSSSWTSWRTNSLVEEFMLRANTSVAGKIYEVFPQTAMLRCRGSPPSSNLEDLKNQLVTRALTLHTITAKALADPRDRFIDPYNPFFNTLVHTLSVRRMLSAEHFSSATQGYPEFRHCGLAIRIYTYHTSHPPSAAMWMSLRTFNLGLRSATSHYIQKSTRK
ncbi:hypothetical protein HOY82DRAFT_124859 [Tuber indicum]|nr:hypothetical protein HOY82DRAFT_124859 [Tuber indicum]